MVGAQSKPRSNALRAVDKLREMILSGELASGTDHLESELAERLNLSRTPVREAALMLEAQGLLEVRPRKGVRILSLSVSDMREIYDVLTELESLAARNAAEANYSANELSGLLRAIEDMDDALKAEDREKWSDADERFHQELLRLGGNSRVTSIVSMMGDQIHRARTMTLHMRPLPTKSNEDHRELYDAIKRGDADGAAKIHHAHRKHAGNLLVELLKRIQISRI
ncbi:GntR family transcriptional regulator [Falsihalocynthiibacter sp. SS001]|uniref:GntR family transcriptional regulator n=1 Tax=Falsihalocynthiibacter sp. SS001 TaxID=3349698 RepID=UPI0036D35545